jgi:hypothetical protein
MIESSVSLPSSGQTIFKKIGSARFLTISLLVHALIVFFAGSVVYVRYHDTKPDFAANDGLITQDTPVEPPAPAPTMPQQEPQATAPAQAPQPVSPAITNISALTVDVPDATSSLGKISDLPALNASLTTGGGDPGATGMGQGSGKGSFFGKSGEDGKPMAAFAGTFYDLKQLPGKRPSGLSVGDYHNTFRKFEAEGWHDGILNKYFHAPKPIYATQIFIPDMPADNGPAAFGLENEVQPGRWLVLYKARVSPPQDGTYHFVGAGDDVMLVRFNGKTVLDRCWYGSGSKWTPVANYDYGFSGISGGFAKGDAIKVEAKQAYDMEVLIGEEPGGLMFSSLLIEQEGATYEKDSKGNPILPVFRVADTPMPPLEEGQSFPPYQPNGPVWKVVPKTNDFGDLMAPNQ